MLASGTNLGGFLIRRLLGQGMTGEVYYGWNPAANAPVALKVLMPELAPDSGLQAMFEQEAKACLSLDSPHIVKALRSGVEGGIRYIAFEYIHGLPLANLIEKGPLGEAQGLWVLRQMGMALRELRRKGIVHQDIKPENVMIEKSGNCKLSDFGFARMAFGPVNWDGFAAGTAFYMSPEQCSPQQGVEIDHRADLYALGAVIYHAVVGSPPLYAAEEAEVYRLQLTEVPVLANERNPRLTGAFASLLAEMLEKDREQRMQTPEELLLRIRALPVQPSPPEVSTSQVTSWQE